MTLYDEYRRAYPIAAEPSEFRGIIEAEVKRALEWMMERDALSERHQRLVEAARGALELILGAPGIICRPDLCETCARCQTRDGNDCLLVTNLKAVLEGEKGAQETSCQATHE